MTKHTQRRRLQHRGFASANVLARNCIDA